jgi:amino acid adenylation domain-containing protein/FkbM family methyltransferase
MLKENYKMTEALKTIYKANGLGIWLWVQDDALKFKAPEQLDAPGIMEALKQHKEEIISTLKENGVTSSNPDLPFIYRTAAENGVLSFAQERLWFVEQYEGGSNAYHIPWVYQLDGHADKDGIIYALQQVVSRHEVLRSTITQDISTGNGVFVLHHRPLAIEAINLTDADDYEAIIKKDINRPFDLSNEYPLRAKFYHVEPNTQQASTITLLLINMHHIVSDGWSSDIFAKELFAFYEAYISKDTAFSLPPLEIQYKDYAMWQRCWAEGGNLEQQLSYWRNQLTGFQPLELATDFPRPDEKDYHGAFCLFDIAPKAVRQIRALTEKLGVTLHSVIRSCFSVLLSKYTGQDDIVMGGPSANRHHRQTEGVIGFFINTQAYRTRLDASQLFADLVNGVHKAQTDAQLYQDLPFDKLVDELGVERDPSRHPLFQVMLSVQNFGDQNKANNQRDSFLAPYKMAGVYEIEKFDITIIITDKGDEIWGNIGYATSLFKQETIERMIHHFQNLLEQLTAFPDRPYSQATLLTTAEYEQVVHDWNKTDKVYHTDKTIVSLFEQQVAKNPQDIALSFKGNTMTYRQLANQSDKLATYLKTNYNTAANDLIGIMLDRSDKVIIAILGILKAGAAYVCIDPSYPVARKEFIVTDTAIKVLITQSDYVFDIDFYGGSLFAMDFQLDSIAAPVEPLKYNIAPADLAYVIYTSGTTGNPKGVMVEHRSVVNYVNNVAEVLLPSIEHIDFSTNIAFDLTITTTICSLLLGKKMFIYPGELNDTDSYVRHLIENNIDFIKSTPSLLANLPAALFANNKIKQAFVGGEKLDSFQLAHILSYVENVVDEYGPTEATVGTSYSQKNDPADNQGIGRPYNNYKVYVLDANRLPVPVGIAGELYIGGAGLSRGYLNRPDITDARFVPNPFATETDKANGYTRLYRTGDLVRWQTNGNLEYIGRNDDQVKIRGYRIELGEIEHALLKIDGVRQACAIVKERKTDAGNTKDIIGYYVVDKDSVGARANYMEEVFGEKIAENNLCYDVLENGIGAFGFSKSHLKFLHREIFESDTYLSDISVKSGDIIFDVGANIGLAAVYFSEQASSLTVYSFEPIDKLYDVLNMNLFMHSAAATFKSFNCGLGSKEQWDVPFSFFKNDTTISTQYPDLEGDSQLLATFIDNTSNIGDSKTLVDFIMESREEVLCRIRTVSAIMREDKIEQIDLLKIDVEKAELDVLEGIEEDDWAKIRQIIIEVHDKENRLAIIQSLLVQKGYSVSTLQEKDLENTEIYMLYAIRDAIDTVAEKNNPALLKENNAVYDLIRSYKRDADKDSHIAADILLAHLKKTLPGYMIPSALVEIAALPLTVNGKLDKKALPDPDFSISGTAHIVPSTEAEKVAYDIWKALIGAAQFGVTDDFFKIGGNSILAIQVSHRMSKALGCDVKVADIFKHKTIAQLLLHCTSTLQANISPISADTAPLSFAQERLWFIEQYEGGTNAYQIPMLLELGEATDMGGMIYALQQVVKRHEVLRSHILFDAEKVNAVQQVQDGPLSVETVWLNGQEDYRSLIKEDINRSFDLSREHPIRAKFYVIDPAAGQQLRKKLLLISTHHIASDGWSAKIFVKELSAYYEAYINNTTGFALPALEIQYKDFAVWQKSYLAGDVLAQQLSYWKHKLTGYQPLELPTDYPRPANIDYKGARQHFVIDSETAQKIRLLIQNYGASLHSVMLSSFSILLGKYAGQDDIVVGTPVANRHHRQTDALIGLFVNSLINRIILAKEQTYAELIQQVHEAQAASQRHQDLPFEKLIDELGVERDTSRHPVFQVMFSVEAIDSDSKKVGEQEQYFKHYEIENAYQIEKFDMSVVLGDDQTEMFGYVSYATSLFSDATIERFINHYLHLLGRLTEAPDKPYSAISLLIPEEYNRSIYEWNATEKHYPEGATVISLFEAQARNVPDRVALAHAGVELTYRELNEKVNQLAKHIRAEFQQRTGREMVPDTLVALCLERSLEMVVGILAVLKAGGAYVPIDPGYPRERIAYMLLDTSAELVLTQRRITDADASLLPMERVLHIDLAEGFYEAADKSNLTITAAPESLAYVIYTSGTTGRPKGVMVEHRAFVQFIYNFNEHLHHLTGKDGRDLLSLTNYVFDIFGLEYALPLTTGYKVTLSSVSDTTEADILCHDIIQQTPSTLLHLADQYANKLYKVTCLVGGEALPAATAAKLVAAFDSVINVYGPAETVIWSTSFKVTDPNIPSIGHPLPNEQVYVLDGNRQPVPIGVAGELYIGGNGLSRGYLNLPELTAEKFVDNPFATTAARRSGHTRLYKTGDRARWTTAGILEYMGRNDDQVKLRGHRIELGEIEHAMAQVEGIAQACVLVKERETGTGASKYLVGYYSLDNNQDMITDSHILEYLAETLPDYMVPAVLVKMTAMPVTVNGKLDKRALPEPDFHLSQTEYVAPDNDIEAGLCNIWEELLDVERVGVTDSFFRIGGNSILAIQVSYQMSLFLQCDVKIADIFKFKSIAGLVAHMKIPEADYENSVKEFS